MEKKSFEQLYRMLKLINHKQIDGKVNIKEAIKKAEKNRIFLKEEDNKDDEAFDLDFLVHDEAINKETKTQVESGSDPEYYANQLSSETGGDRAFDIPYRMWLLRIPYGQIQIKINNYNSSVKDESKKIKFDFDENGWIEQTRERKVTAGTIGVPGNLKKIGKYIIEFMSRIYTGKLNPIEQAFDKSSGGVFSNNYAKNVANSFIRMWLNTVVFEVSKRATKAVFKDEIDDRIMLQAKEASVDYIMLTLSSKYDPRRANFYAWSLTVMNNIIKNRFTSFGERSVVDTDYLVSYLDSLKYPYMLKTSRWFSLRLNEFFGKKEGKNKLTPEDWLRLKEESGTSFEGEPVERIENEKKYFYFKYVSPNDMLNDILSSNEVSLSQDVKTISPLYALNIGDNALREAVFKSGLRATGEGEHKNIQKTRIDNVVISYDKSKLKSENPEDSLTFDFPSKWTNEDKENWVKFQRNSNWEKFNEFYNDKTSLEDAAIRSISLSDVTDDETNVRKTDGSFEYNLDINKETIKIKNDNKKLEIELKRAEKQNNPALVSRIQKDIEANNEKIANKEESSETKKIKNKIDELRGKLIGAKRKKDEEAIRDIQKSIDFYDEEIKEKNNVTVSYTVVPGHTGHPKEVQITSIVDKNGNEIDVDDEVKDILKYKAKEEVENQPEGNAIKAPLGTTEIPDFEETGEERIKRIMGTKKFLQKFLETISKVDKGADIITRFKSISNRIIGEQNPALVKEFYSFVGNLIAESIIAIGKPFTKGDNPKAPGIHGKEGKNIKDIYNGLYEEYVGKLQSELSPEDLNKMKSYLKFNDDNLAVMSRSITAFVYANKKNKKSTFAGMGLDEAKRIISDAIRKLISENFMNEFGGNQIEADLDEERISNHDGSEKVNSKKNFIGSQVFGEDIGDIGAETNWKDGMYGVFSYGEQFPIYIYTNVQFHDQDGNLKNKDGKFRWFHNIEPYKFDIDSDGEKEIMSSVEKHKELLRPSAPTHGLTRATLSDMINAFKNKHKIKELSHVSILPGEGAGIHYGDGDKQHDKRKD